MFDGHDWSTETSLMSVTSSAFFFIFALILSDIPWWGCFAPSRRFSRLFYAAQRRSWRFVGVSGALLNTKHYFIDNERFHTRREGKLEEQSVGTIILKLVH